MPSVATEDESVSSFTPRKKTPRGTTSVNQTACARPPAAQTRLSYIHEHCRNAKKCVFGTGDLAGGGMDLDGMGGENGGGGGDGAGEHASGCGGLLVRLKAGGSWDRRGRGDSCG